MTQAVNQDSLSAVWARNAAACTDRGKKRDVNEDTVFHRSARLDSGESVGLYIVCDGIGGHQAGEVASRLAVETVTAELANIVPTDKSGTEPGQTQPVLGRMPTIIRAAVAKANVKIRQYAQAHPEKAGNLGTTITLVTVRGKQAWIANVGDSRTYIWRAGQLSQITQDHSFAARLADMGVIAESEVADHPRGNVISRSLGADNTDRGD